MKTVTSRVPRDKDFPERVWQIEVRKRVLDGSLYDVMEHQYHEDKMSYGASQEFIPEHKRAPSTKVGLSLIRMTIEDGVSFVFGEGRFPSIHSEDETTREFFADLIKTTKLQSVMRDAVFRGSTGSVCVRMRVLKSKIYFDVLDTQYLTPEYDPEAPDTLIKVTEKYKVKGIDLRNQGYVISDDNTNADHWFMRIFDVTGELYYLPSLVSDDNKPGFSPRIDDARTKTHELGFLPMVWIRNLTPTDDIDGACIFDRAIEAACQIDYRMSSADRALLYSSDPLLLIKSPAHADGEIMKNSSTAIVVDKDGDAKILEINGAAVDAVHKHVETLREFINETMHAVRATPDRIQSATSGKALELLYAPMIRIADGLRASYGEGALLDLARMVLRATNILPLKIGEREIPKMAMDQRLSLVWGAWFTDSSHDLFEKSQALSVLAEAGHISRDTAVRSIAGAYDIENIPVELANIEKDQAAEDARLKAQAAQVQAKETP